MHVGRQLAWFGLGFCAVTLLGFMAAPRVAHAQGTPTSITTINPPPQGQALTPRTRGLPPAAPAETLPRRGQTAPVPIPDDPPANPDTAADAGDDGDTNGTRDGNGAPGAPGTAGTDAAGTPVATPPIVGQRPALRDGDLSAEQGPTQEIDGVIVTGEPRGPQDGVDATINDTRSPDDIAAFEAPPAGFDPQLFQVEVDPILDRRPERLFRFEPFDPRGIKLGAFVLLPEIEFGSGFYSNLFRSSRARSDFVFDVRPTARLVSNWRTHALEFRGTGNFSRFIEFSTENDRAYTIESRGRLDLSRRTSLEALVSRDVSQDIRSSINAPLTAANRADITTDRYAGTLNHRFNRLSVQLRGSYSDTTFGPTDAIAGGTISNRDRDIRTTEEAVRATWEFKPTLFTFVDTAFNQRSYQAAAFSDGILRDSNGERYRAGVSFGNSSQILRGEISLGYGRQRPEDGRLREISGVLFDASLAYRHSALTSFLFSARTDVTETTLANSSGAFSRQIGLDIRHGFRRDLIGTAGTSYTLQEFTGSRLSEIELRTTAGLEYFLNRQVVLFGRYQNTIFDTNDRGRSYTGDEVRVGVRVRR